MTRFWREFPLTIGASSVLSAGLIALALLPLRFAVMAAAGLLILGLAALVENKRVYFLSLLTLAVTLNTSKRLFVIPGPGALTDAFLIQLTDALLVLAYGHWMISPKRGAADSSRPSATGPILAMMGAGALSLINSEWSLWSLAELSRMAKTFLLYWFIVQNIHNRDELHGVLRWIAIGLLGQAAVVLLQKYGGGSLGLLYFGEAREAVRSFADTRTLVRTGGTLGHPNQLAYYLDLVLPLMLSLGFSPALKAPQRRLYTLAFFAGALCLFFTYSRGGWLASAGATAMCFLALAKRNLRQNAFVGRTWVVAMAGILGLALAGGKIHERFASRDAGSVQARLDQYRLTRRLIEAHPWLGVGLNTFQNVAPHYDDTASRIATRFQAPVHNAYLLAWSETGLVGLAALLWLIIVILSLAYFRRWPYGETYDLHLGFFFGFLAYFIHLCVDMNRPGSHGILFFLAALLTATHRLGRAAAAAPQEAR